MTSRIVSLPGIKIIPAFVVCCLVGTSPASASDLSWDFSAAKDPDNHGRMTATLDYGVPETDNVQLRAVCDSGPGPTAGKAMLTIAANVGKLDNGKAVDLRFSGGGVEQTINGQVSGVGAEEGITGVTAAVAPDDPLWTVLGEQDTIDYMIPGYRSRQLDLAAGHGQIAAFNKACRDYEAAAAPQMAANGQTTPESGMSEADAFKAARELNTIDGWNAFLKNYSSGFRADLARAYVQKLQSASAPPPAAPAAAPAAAPPPPPPVETLQTVDLGQSGQSWVERAYKINPSTSVRAGVVQANGIQLAAYCNRHLKASLLLRAHPNGIYPDFDQRISQGLTQGVNITFSNGASADATAWRWPNASVAIGNPADPTGFAPNGAIVQDLIRRPGSVSRHRPSRARSS